MSYFIDDEVYIIVPKADVTAEMLNHMKKYFYSPSIGTLRESSDGRVILKIRTEDIELIPSDLSGYPWLNYVDIKEELSKAEWQDL
jgi:hypothetical protein